MSQTQPYDTPARPSGRRFAAIVFLLDVLVIFAPTARWDRARAAM